MLLILVTLRHTWCSFSMTVLSPHAYCVLQAVEVWFGLSDTSEVVQLSPSLLRKLSSSGVPTLLSQSLTVEFDEGGVLNLVRVTLEHVMVVIGDGLKLVIVISNFYLSVFFCLWQIKDTCTMMYGTKCIYYLEIVKLLSEKIVKSYFVLDFHPRLFRQWE